MNAQFLYPWVLLFLWLALAAGFGWHYSARRRNRTLARFVSTEMQAKLCPQTALRRHAWQTVLATLGLALMVIAAARPQWGEREETIYQRGRDLMIALDVSRSMLANDVRPSRLQRAKVDLMDLIRELRGDRAGLLAFRNKGILLCPLTTDYAYLKLSLEAADLDSAPSGETDLADAIRKSMDAFASDTPAHKAIILISDGEDLGGKALEAAEEAKKRGIPIFTVGLGSRSGSRIPGADKKTPFLRFQDEDVVTKLNHDTLYAIAEKTGGAYVPVETASMTRTTLGTLYRERLRAIDARDLEESIQRRYVERYQWFLFPAILCMIGAGLLSKGRLALTPVPRSVATPLKDLNPPPQVLRPAGLMIGFLLVWLSAAASSPAQQPQASSPARQPLAAAMPSNPPPPVLPAPATAESATPAREMPIGLEGARMAQALYGQGKYEEAARIYLNAAAQAARKSQRNYRYNGAVALFKAKKYREAAETLRELSAAIPEDDPAVETGLGSTLFRAAQDAAQNATNTGAKAEAAELLKQSGDAFREALRAKPEDKQVRANLGTAIDSYRKLEDQAKIEALLEKYQGKDAAQVAGEMLATQRKVNEATLRGFETDSPDQIQILETAAEDQKTAADLWIPLKSKILEAAAQQQNPSNQQQVAMMEQQIEATRRNMLSTSQSLRDLDPRSGQTAQISEAAIYQLWKSIAPFSMLLQEDIRRQGIAIAVTTNAVTAGEAAEPPAPHQQEAIVLSELFLQRFTNSVPESGTPLPEATAAAQADTNAPPAPPAEQAINAENRAKIVDLSRQAIAAQNAAAGQLKDKQPALAVPEEQRALQLLKEIEKLLPKNQQQQQQQQDQQQQQQQEQKQQDQQEQQQQQQQEQKQEQKDSGTVEPKEEKQQEQQAQENKENTNKPPEDVAQLLEKALQREREHEAKKRQRAFSVPMSARERDW